MVLQQPDCVLLLIATGRFIINSEQKLACYFIRAWARMPRSNFKWECFSSNFKQRLLLSCSATFFSDAFIYHSNISIYLPVICVTFHNDLSCKQRSIISHVSVLLVFMIEKDYATLHVEQGPRERVGSYTVLFTQAWNSALCQFFQFYTFHWDVEKIFL